MIQHHTKAVKKSGGLLAAALLASSLVNSPAGEMIAKTDDGKAVTAKAPASNPLSFCNGLFTFDVQKRLRWEIRENNFDFNETSRALTDDSWLLQRFRIGLLIKPTDWLKIYAQGQDSREFFSDRPKNPGVLGAEGDDAFDLRQGYIEIGNPKTFPLTAKIGRQILSFGDERLVGAFDWNNIGRTFDAVKLRWEQKGWSVDAFASAVVVPERNSYNQSDFANGNETHRGQIFSGVYFETTSLLPFQATDFYVFHLHENTTPKYLPAAAGNTDFATFGMRGKSKPGAFAPKTAAVSDGKSTADGKSDVDAKTPAAMLAPKAVGLDYTYEFAYQTGHVRGLDLSAFAAHADAGYTFDTSWRPRVALGYSFATGDSRPGDGDLETFQNLFPTNHKFYGQADFFSWQNLHDLELDFKVVPIKSVTLRADYHAFFAMTNEDVWYRANGATAVRPLSTAARNADKFEGTEIDLIATWAVNKYVSLEGGYSHFFAGNYLKDTGAHDDADFGYVMATITF